MTIPTHTGPLLPRIRVSHETSAVPVFIMTAFIVIIVVPSGTSHRCSRMLQTQIVSYFMKRRRVISTPFIAIIRSLCVGVRKGNPWQPGRPWQTHQHVIDISRQNRTTETFFESQCDAVLQRRSKLFDFSKVLVHKEIDNTGCIVVVVAVDGDRCWIHSHLSSRAQLKLIRKRSPFTKVVTVQS